MSTISFFEDGATEGHNRPAVRMENTFQLSPNKRFPSHQVKAVIREVLEGYLAEEKYEAELCRQMTKTISEVGSINSHSCQMFTIINTVTKGTVRVILSSMTNFEFFYSWNILQELLDEIPDHAT